MSSGISYNRTPVALLILGYRVLCQQQISGWLKESNFFAGLAPLEFEVGVVRFTDEDEEVQKYLIADLIDSPIAVETQIGSTIIASDDGTTVKVVTPNKQIETILPSERGPLRHALLTEVKPPKKSQKEEQLIDGFVGITDPKKGKAVCWKDSASGRYYSVRFGVRALHFDWILNGEKQSSVSLLDCVTLHDSGSVALWNSHSLPPYSAIQRDGPNGIEVLRAGGSNTMRIWEKGFLVATAIFNGRVFQDKDGVWNSGWAVAYGDGMAHPGDRGRNPSMLIVAAIGAVAIGSMFIVPDQSVPIVAGSGALYGVWRLIR